MRVLFCVRHNFYSSPGGAQIQIEKTKEFLEKKGLACDLTTTAEGVDFSRYDIVHLTDLTWVYDLLQYQKKLKDFKGKKVLSTIYWPFDEYAGHGAPFAQKCIFYFFGINGFEFVKSLGKLLSQRRMIYLEGLKKSYIQNQKSIVKGVDWILPNSFLEAQALFERLKLENIRFSVVNNAIDTELYDSILKEKSVKKNPNLITYVARIDPRKNQLNFLKALYGTDYQIKFIGNAGPNSGGYYEKLKALAKKRGNVDFISHISQENVFRAMLEAKVNALVSWVETPGLVSLEAAYARCNIVVSDKGSVKEYFKEHAFYCDPDDLKAIRNQTIKAMQSDPKQQLMDEIRSQYNWSKAAEQTLEAYEEVLKLRK